MDLDLIRNIFEIHIFLTLFSHERWKNLVLFFELEKSNYVGVYFLNLSKIDISHCLTLHA